MSQGEVLRELLGRVTVAALGTFDGEEPFVSMTPYAVAADGRGIILHVSRLAAHTRNMLRHPAVSLLMMEPEGPGKMAQALARVTVQGTAQFLEATDEGYAEAREAYLERFPRSAELFSFGDFGLVLVSVRAARLVGGFAQAHSLTAEAFARAVTS
ncbi:MAG: HugZ family protein [Planctomycetaceae bacterium]|jgi:putative heme iron utilization protein